MLALVGCKQPPAQGEGNEGGKGVGADFLPNMRIVYDLLEEHGYGNGPIFTKYATFDLAGVPVMLFSDEDEEGEALFCFPNSDTYQVLGARVGAGHLDYYEQGLVGVEGCGTGCSNTTYVCMTDKGFVPWVSHYAQYDPDGDLEEQEFYKGVTQPTEEEGMRLVEEAKRMLGKPIRVEPVWKPLPRTLENAPVLKCDFTAWIPAGECGSFVLEGEDSRYVWEGEQEINEIYILRFVRFEETVSEAEQLADGGVRETLCGRLVVDAYDPDTHVFAARYEGEYRTIANYDADGEFSKTDESYSGTCTKADGTKEDFNFSADE